MRKVPFHTSLESVVEAFFDKQACREGNGMFVGLSSIEDRRRE